ncbi:RDD family protein [Zooshikella sp. RANM57]|uniref:RDD family protein n=1 Tax=Zooshikella sp. RANM57 TaxID=3425863 RepID=UPI003D6F9BF1
MLDTGKTYETPEGIRLELDVAGPLVRVTAFLIDFVIRAVVFLILWIILEIFGDLGFGLFLIFAFIIDTFYGALFEAFYNGQTPGKRAMNIQVINENFTPVSFSRAFLRNLIRYVDWLPLFYVTGLITMALRHDFKRLGDLAAGTLVVYNEPTPKLNTLPDVTPVKLPIPLAIEEQRAIINFAERYRTISNARAEELANIVEPVFKREGTSAVTYLHQLAKGLLSSQ